MIRRHLLLSMLALATAVVSCATGEEDPDLGVDTSYSAEMASTWHYAGAPQRIQVGVLASDANGLRVVTQGSVDLSFSYLGTDGGGEPSAGPTATASYVPVPGTDASGDAPAIVTGANGVYEAEDVTFDEAGIWRATLSIEIDSVARQLPTDFRVDAESEIPAPGMPALATENLTMDSKVRPGAIDSMADGGGEIPDAELHEWTIADAIAQHRPALVLFGTPAYCTSRFCGPEVTELQQLATEHPDRAVFIHVEIWKEYEPPETQVVNEGAADWLLRQSPDGTPEMTEPWLYLIGSDGIIADRWGPLFDSADVAAALEALPPMES
jgi:hypothetical protein